MCGIFGFISAPESNFTPQNFKALIDGLFLSSESRGKDASGIMLFNNSDLEAAIARKTVVADK
jgi:glucosamine 6-phosphate synthetase-like amidotransferase/phosphosugar isomerase protein